MSFDEYFKNDCSMYRCVVWYAWRTSNWTNKNYKLIQSQPFAYFVRVHIFYDLHSIQYITISLMCWAYILHSFRKYPPLILFVYVSLCVCLYLKMSGRVEKRKNARKWKSCHYDICGKIGINNECGNILLRIWWKFTFKFQIRRAPSTFKGDNVFTNYGRELQSFSVITHSKTLSVSCLHSIQSVLHFLSRITIQIEIVCPFETVLHLVKLCGRTFTVPKNWCCYANCRRVGNKTKRTNRPFNW